MIENGVVNNNIWGPRDNMPTRGGGVGNDFPWQYLIRLSKMFSLRSFTEKDHQV